VYAKVFSQIFDSSIASDWQVRHVFEDFLKLCDEDGVVDMTVDAIHRRTNVPIEIIQRAIDALEKPDPQSRSQVAEGRRIMRLDEHRAWGWMVVNYGYYRGLASEHQKREKTRERVRSFRSKQQELIPDCNTLSVTQRYTALPYASASSSSSGSQKGVQGEDVQIPDTLDVPEFRKMWGEWEEHRKEIKKPMTPRSKKMCLSKCEEWGVEGSIIAIRESIAGGWWGLFAPKENGAKAKSATNEPPLWRKIQIIEEQIAKHPANHTWSGFNPQKLSETMKGHLKELRATLAKLKSEEAATIK
jgi:hypothetical protein